MLDVWHKATVNFLSREALISRVEKQMSAGCSKITPSLRKQLLHLSPLDLAQIVCRVGRDLPPRFSQSLKKFVLEEGITDCWLKLLTEEPATEIKLSVIEALGVLRVSQVVWTLIEILKSRNEALQLAAAGALERIASRQMIPRLVEGLKKGEFWLPARIAPIILTRSELSLPLLKQLLAEEGLEDHVYLVAIELLQEMRRPELALFLEQIFSQHRVKVQKKILEVLTELRVDRAKIIAVSLLKHADWQLRLQAVNTLKQLGESDLIALLEPLTQDENEKVRQAATWVVAGWIRGEGSRV